MKQCRRRDRIAAWSDYTTFLTAKAIALTLVVCGLLDIVRPSLIPSIQHPETFLGGGLALLTGKGVLSVVAKALKPLGVK